MLLAIAYQEGGKTLDPKCFSTCFYGPNFTALQQMPQVPEWWAKIGPPRHGFFSVTYAADEGNVKLRKKYAKETCGWDI